MLNSNFKILLLFVGLFFITTNGNAQTDPPGPPCPPTCPNIPIDGGISILAALGIGYGAKKVRDLRK